MTSVSRLLTFALCCALFACGGGSSPTSPRTPAPTPVPPPPPIFSRSGVGDTAFDLPATVTRIRVQASYGGRVSNFIIAINHKLLVNELLGTAYATTFEGTYNIASGGGTLEVLLSTTVSWTITELR